MQSKRYAASHGAVAPLPILAEADVDCVMVFRYVPIDVVETSVAGLHIDVTTEYELEERDEGGYGFLGASGEE